MKKFAFPLSFAGLILLLNGCIQTNFDEPPLNIIPEGNVITIGDLKDIYNDSVILGPYLSSYKFTDDYSLYAVVTIDDKSGNLYKAAYIEDATGAINMRLLSSGGVYEGDSVRVYLKGLVISVYNGMFQLDSVDVDKNVIKQATLRNPQPTEVNINQILAGGYQGRLIKLNNVQFLESEIGLPYADALNLTTMNRTIEDCDGNQLIVRTSGYAKFAGATTPEGKGSIIGVVDLYRVGSNSTWQLYIRRTSEVLMNGLRCGQFFALLNEDFSSVSDNQPIALDNWINLATTGTVVWLGSNNGIDTRAKITGTGDNVSWLITPVVNLDDSDNEYLSFNTRALNVAGSELKVYISTNYDGGNNPASATWTELNANIASGSDITQSGQIDISGYSGNVRIAFKYSALLGATGSFYLDNVVVAHE